MEELNKALQDAVFAIRKLFEPIISLIIKAARWLMRTIQHWWKLLHPRQSAQTKAFLRIQRGQPDFTPHAHKRRIHTRQRMYA